MKEALYKMMDEELKGVQYALFPKQSSTSGEKMEQR
jgi:hypothetical protein